MTEATREPLMITGEEFNAWSENKITKHVVQEIVDIREHLKNYLASGSTLAKDADVTTDRLVGRIEGLTELFRMFEDTKEDTKEIPEYGH